MQLRSARARRASAALRAILLAGLFSTVLAACGSDEPEVQPTAAPTRSPAPTPRGDPDVKIEAPLSDQRIVGDQIGVSAIVGGIEVVDRIGRKPAEGEGHLIFYLDADDIPTEAGQPAYSAKGTYEVVAGTRHIWQDVEPGDYDVGVQLVNNNDTPLDPPVTDEVRVTVSLRFKDPGNTPPAVPTPRPGS